MNARSTLPSDDRVRTALTREPSPGLAANLFAELAVGLESTPQVRRWRIGWPTRDGVPAVGGSRVPRPLGTLAFVVVAILALAASVAVVGFIGGLRHAPPLGLARPGLVAYDSGGDIFLANPDGTSSLPITSGTDKEIEPTFSLDGSRLAWFTVVAGTTDVRLVVANADGSQARVIASLAAADRSSGAQVSFLRIAWSPDGTRIAYAAPVAARARLFVVRLDGSPAMPIGPTDLEAQDPVWSPDGQRIAFRGGHFDDDRGIYVLDADGSGEPTRITESVEAGIAQSVQFSVPAWSPDGASIAYSRVAAPPESHVIVGAPTGGITRDISGPGAIDWAPAWSPDGSWLAWRTGPAASAGRFVVARPDGSQRSTMPPTVIGTPVWSPDGRTLVAAGPDLATGFTDRLLLIDIVTGESRQITAVPNGDASWQRLAP